MPDAPEPPQASARSPLAGCTILIIALCVMLFLIGFSTWALFRQAAEIEKFTDLTAKPPEVSQLEGQEPAVLALNGKVDAFQASLAREEESRLELSADELNLAIASDPALSELKGTFRVRELREDGSLVADICFPINGKPRRAKDNEPGIVASDGRFLNGSLVTRPELGQGEIVLRIDAIEVPGKTVVDPFRQQMSPYRITERYLADPVLGPVMKKLTSVKVESGKITFIRSLGVTPPATITKAQVDAGSTRFLKGMAVAACVFLGLIGLFLLIGWRVKARRTRSENANR
jgi:hypothetical protein